MQRNGSLLWILFLLAAMFLGPTMIMRKMRAGSAVPTLRTMIEQERLIDAPHSAPSLPAASPPRVDAGRTQTKPRNRISSP